MLGPSRENYPSSLAGREQRSYGRRAYTETECAPSINRAYKEAYTRMDPGCRHAFLPLPEVHKIQRRVAIVGAAVLLQWRAKLAPVLYLVERICTRWRRRQRPPVQRSPCAYLSLSLPPFLSSRRYRRPQNNAATRR